jgi:hypothetical protein
MKDNIILILISTIDGELNIDYKNVNINVIFSNEVRTGDDTLYDDVFHMKL